MRRASGALGLVAVLGCGGEAPPAAEDAGSQRCPRVHLDRLEGDWVLASGDPKTRFRVVRRGDRTLLWYVDPAFSNHKLELEGVRREKDWQFDERPRGRRAALVEKGGEALKRVYVAPKPERCQVDVYQGVVGVDDKEVVAARAKTFLPFPDQPGAVFSYHPHDEPLFLGDAAKSKARADRQLAELGEPRPDVEMGKVTAAVFSAVEADGDPSCAYTFDAWFDDRPVEGGEGVAATAPEGGVRAWRYTFDAPYTGNHRLELHRWRTCGEGPRELLAVAGIDAILE